MAIVFYLMAFAISLIAIVLLTFTEKSQNIRFYLLMFISIAISNAGYLAIVASKSLETAILGNNICYLGSCFLPFFMFLAITSFCDFRVSKTIKIILMIYSFLMLLLPMSVGYSDIYYSYVELRTDSGFSYLYKEYGPFHILYTIMLYSYVLACLAIVVYSIFKKRKVSYKNLIAICISELILVAVYFGERQLQLKFEWMAFAYLSFEVVVLVLLRRIAMYDIDGNVINARNHMEKNAYIIFDRKMNYTGSNALAEKFFPELCDIKVDMRLEQDKNRYLYDNFQVWIEECEQSDAILKSEAQQHIFRDGMELKCSLRYLYYGKDKRIVGYLAEIVDDTKQQEYIHLLNHYNTELEASVNKQTKHILDMQNKMILGMANMVESRDDNTGGHIRRTSEVVKILVEELKKEHLFENVLSDRYCAYIVKAAPMHDLGKIAVSDNVLKKPEIYLPEEYEQMKLHAKKGAEIVETVLKDVEDEKFVQISKNIAHFHHEKWDGSGYPEGLAAEEIPLEARIMALADVYDAIVSKRCYKERIPYDQAVTIIEDSLGKHFDPVIGKAFLNCHKQVEFFYRSMEETSS